MNLLNQDFLGNQQVLKDNITIVKDARFTTCKKTNETDGCALLEFKSKILILLPYWTSAKRCRY